MNGSASGRPLRVLCISPAFVPVASSEAVCGAKMLMALEAEGLSFTVLYNNGMLMDPRWQLDTSSTWSCFKDSSVPLTYPLDKKLVRMLTTLAYYRIRGARWVDLAVREAYRLHQQKPFDLVYSRSFPTFAHPAGYYCARACGGVPWVANINDPWDAHLFPDSNRQDMPWMWARLSEYWMRKTLREANLVTYPCRRLMEFTERIAGVSSRAAEVVPHVGWSAAPQGSGNEFRLVHAGNLLSANRPVDGLLGGLKTFLTERPEAQAATRLLLVGPDDDQARPLISRFGLEGIVRCTGRVSYQESLEWIGSATACVLVEAPMAEGVYLPSKFADYAAAAKPILALSPRVGTIADLLPDPAVIRADVDDEKAIAAAIGELYADFRNGSLARRGASSGLGGMFSPSNVARRFTECLRQGSVLTQVPEKGNVGGRGRLGSWERQGFLLNAWKMLTNWVDERLPEGSLRARFAKGAFWAIAGVVVAQGLALVASVLVVRIFHSPFIYGRVGMFRSTVSMFGALAGLSLGMTNIKYVAEFRKTDPARAGRIIGLSNTVSVVASAVMALALVVAASWLAENVMGAPIMTSGLRVGGLILFFETLNGVQIGTLTGCEAFRTLAWLSLVRGLINFPFMVGGAWLGIRYDRPVLGISIALALSAMAGWVLYHAVLRRQLRGDGITVTRRGCTAEMHVLWRFSLPATLNGALLGPVLWASNAVLINRHPKGYDELGVFNAASQWQLPITFLSAQMATILLPMLSSFARDDAGKTKGGVILDATYIITAVATIPVVAIVACFATFVMKLYGAQYSGTEMVLIAVLFVAGSKAVGAFLGTVIASCGAMWSMLLINSVWSVSFLVLVYFWSPRGAQGLADSFSLAYAASAIYGVLYCVRRGFFGWSMAWRLWALIGALGVFSYGFVLVESLPWSLSARVMLLAVALGTTLAVGWPMWRNLHGQGRVQ